MISFYLKLVVLLAAYSFVENLRLFWSTNRISSLQVCEHHPQGVVLVRFKDRRDAQKCIEAMNGRWYKLS